MLGQQVFKLLGIPAVLGKSPEMAGNRLLYPEKIGRLGALLRVHIAERAVDGEEGDIGMIGTGDLLAPVGVQGRITGKIEALSSGLQNHADGVGGHIAVIRLDGGDAELGVNLIGHLQLHRDAPLRGDAHLMHLMRTAGGTEKAGV